MAIIYSYPVITPTADDLLLGTDQGGDGKPTKNFTIQSIVDLISAGATGLGAVIEINSSAKNAAGGNQSATDFLNISGTGSVSFNSFTDGNMTITNGSGTGFTEIRSTNFIGDLNGIVKAGSSIEGAVTGVTQALGTSDKTLATTEFVMDKVDPSILTFTGTTGGNQTVNLAAQTFSLLGTTSEIKTVSTAQTLTISLADGAFGSGSELILPNGASATTQAATDDSTKVATTAFVKQENDLQDLDFSGTTGTGAVLLNSQTLAIAGTANQVVTSAAGQTLTIALTNPVVRDLTGNVTGILKDGSSIETTVTGVTQTAGNDSTRLATTAYVDAAAGAKVLQYQGDTGGPFSLNLKDDDLDIAGGSNISTTAATVAANLGVITIDLNDDVTISGTMNADKFETTAGTATWTTTVLAGFTKITSALFVGDATASLVAPVPPNPSGTPNNVQFQGNASSANRLGPSDGTIQLSVGTGATLGVSSNAVKYTDGGDITIATSLLNTTVTGKTLQGLPTPAAATVVAGDTILEGIGKLQSQINGIANGLQFQGTWNANIDEGGAGAAPNGTPALTSGGGEATSGTTDATTTDELVDSTKNFTAAPNIVAVGDKVINQADGQTALVTSIANAASGRLGIGADIMLTAEAYIIDKPPFITAGHYYVVDTVGATTAKNATLNGIQDWQVGDWVIASINNVWQKLNNSAVEGSGTPNRLTKWGSAASTLVDSGIIDDGTTIKLQNDTELGGAASDAISSVGVHTIDEQLILKKGLGLLLSDGATPPVFSNNYGASGQVLTSAGASSDTPTWTTPTTGVVESITGGTGITVDDTSNPGTAAIPVVSIDYSGTDNAILAATAATEPILTTDQIWFNDVATLAPATINTIKKAPISSLPFNNYSWDLNVDGGTASTVGNGNEVDFLSGTGIIQSLSTRDVTTALRYSDVNNDPSTGALNFIDATGTAATPDEDDYLIFSDQFDTATKNVVKRAKIKDIIDIGNETLAEVLVNGNTSGANDIVMADSQKVTFGTVPDLQIYHDGTGNNSHIQTTSGSAGDLLIESQGAGHDLYLRAADDIFIQPQGSENGIKVIGDGAVELYHNAVKKLETTSAGIEITGSKIVIDSGAAGNSEHGTIIADATYGLRLRGSVSGTNSEKGGIYVQQSVVRFPGEVIGVSSPNPDITMMQINRTILGSGGNVLTIGDPTSFGLGYKANSVFQGDVDIKGDLSVDGAIIHGGGSATHTAKGGIFSDTINLPTNGTAVEAFTIERTNGSMVFDVYFTDDSDGTDASVAKKFTVVKQYGTAATTISSFKILDTGPGTFSSNTFDFTPEFLVSGTSNSKLKCMITPISAAMNVTYTIFLGNGSTDATIVLN